MAASAGNNVADPGQDRARRSSRWSSARSTCSSGSSASSSPGFDNFAGNAQHEMLIGLFMINPLHNIAHILVGVAGLALARTLAGARTYGWLLAVPVRRAVRLRPHRRRQGWDFLNINAADNVLHILTAVVGLVIALMPVRDAVGSSRARAYRLTSSPQHSRGRVRRPPGRRARLACRAGAPRRAADAPRRYVAGMDFALSAKAEDVCGRMWDFMREHVFPAEPVYEQWRAERGHDNHEHPPVLEELKAEARKRGLWNLFHHELGGLSNLEYASVAEITGWSPTIAPEAMNCGAPDTGNMETLMLFGTDEQKQRWLNPLLEGEIRSGFAMTEPDVAVVRRPQHPDLDRPRRRRVRDQRPQVVDQRRRRRALPDLHRHGQDRPGRRRRTASSRWCWSRGTPRAWRSSGTCRCSGTRTSTGTPSCGSPTSGCR